MASEILGLFTSPEQYNMMQQQAQQNRALQFAQLDPFEKASYGIYQGAGQLANAGARLLGGEDPQLRMISQRQILAKEIDPADPESILRAAQKAGQMGDQQFALTLSDYARKAQSEMALAQQRMREGRAAATPQALQIAAAKAELMDRIEQIKQLPDSPEKTRALGVAQNTLNSLQTVARQGQIPDAIEIAREQARLQGLAEGTPEYNKFVNERIDKLSSKADRVTAYGSDRNAIAQGEFNKDFADLTQEQKKAVNAIADQEKRKVAEASAPKLPGQKDVKDIPGFRDKLLQNVDPFRKTITSTDQGLQSINDSLKTGNFISFKAARTQLAKALDSGTLSRKDIEDAGGDPSILGGAIDWASTKITATPSADTQNRMKSTLTAINRLARQKGQAELDVQRKIATRSGFDQQDVDLIFDIPEFRSKGTTSGAARTNETIPTAVETRIKQIPNESVKAPAPPKKGQKQTRTLKSGKTVTVETE